MSDGRQRWIDEALDRRLAEISAAAGVPHARASLEVLYYLPKDFLQRYTELFHSALRMDSGGVGGSGNPDEAVVKVSSEYRGKRPMVGSGGKRYKEFWVVLSDDALDLKKRVDKRLRTLGRDIALEMSEGRGDEDGRTKRTRCGRCGRIFGRDWNFCAGCGNHRPVGEDD